MRISGRGLAATISLLFVFFLFLPGAWAGDAESEAQALYDTLYNKWLKDRDSLSENLYKPLMTDEVKLRNLNGTEEGNARLICRGKQEALKIEVSASASGDLSYVRIHVNTDLNGGMDYVYTLDGPISAICNEGVVKCSPGTFSNCQWLKWVVDENTRTITAVSVPYDELANCWCFNSGCTSASYSSISDQILNLLGSSVVAAYLRSIPRLAFSGSRMLDSYTIVYDVQDERDCSFDDSGNLLVYGETTPEILYDNPGQLITEGQNEILNQGSDPQSPFYLIQNSPAFSSVQSSACTKERDVSVITSAPSPVTIATVSYPNIATKTLDASLFTKFVFSANYVDERGYLCVNGYLIVYTDPASNYVYDEGAVPCSTNPDTADEPDYTPPSVDVTNRITSTGTVSIEIGVRNFHGPGNGSVSFMGYRCMSGYTAIPSENTCYRINENLLDSCSGYETRDECTVRMEKTYDANGNFVVTVQGGVPTGNTIPPSCKTFLVGSRTIEVCRDWWRIEREYVCEDQGQTNIDLTRVKRVDETLDDTGSTLTYQDVTYENGSWSSPTTHSFSHSLQEYDPRCLPACKVAGYKPPAQTTGVTATSDYRSDPGTQYINYRMCKDSLCPVRPGETILEDCTCLNTFFEGVARIEAARQAGIDMICSDGTRKQ